VSRTGLIACWLLCACPLPAVPPPPAFLLPNDVVPTRHIFELTIDPSRDSFEGLARIEVELHKPASVIWINAKDLTPKEASVESAGRMYPARAHTAGGEFIGLELGSPVGPGRATLSIRYQGRLDDRSLVGAYRRKVGDDWYVFTTFTPIEARRAFPCFDEPRFKTPWELTIHVRRGDQVFANAPDASEVEEPDGMKAVRFVPTEPLPAEVIAFAVGPFDVFDGGPAGHGTPIRVIATKGRGAEGKYAAQAAAEVLPRLEAYTGIPYPFGKLDHLALPEGAFGAVENPGLITYRALTLLAKPAEETPEKTRAIRAVESHEIAHQWFGDMVTQAGWEDVWLSEGFATWLSAKVMDQEQPPERKHLSAIFARERIMHTGNRPVRLAMKNREDTKRVYNPIVYQKGAAVLAMLEGWLGEERIEEGLRVYLRAHRFGNATTDDLAAALGDVPDLRAVLHGVLDATGVPEVSGEIHCDPGAGPSLSVRQRGSTVMPVCWKADGHGQGCAVLHTPAQTVAWPRGSQCPAWFFLNAGGTGYYHTAWSHAPLEALPHLTPAERLTLVYDLRAFKKGSGAAALLKRLASDPEPDIAKAAQGRN
jgi:alanyl aminopeptidase